MRDKITVLIIGSGAREHTISLAYEKSPHVDRIIVTPGNDFIGYRRQKEVIIDKTSSLKRADSILQIANKYKPDLIDVAQDDALATGTVDLLQDNGFRVFGPTKAAARIEWDKRWSREFMQRSGIPHPLFRYFDSESIGKAYAQELYSCDKNAVVYVKAAGLCAGKGALKSTCLDEAIANIEKMKVFGDAGRIFLIEHGLVGEEFSYYAICDGMSYYTLKSAQDNKAAYNFDEGSQTGGMGAISPAAVTSGYKKEIDEQLISKAICGMQREGIRYRGILYLGGIIADGKPMNIEYNARWGDPECQAVLPSLETDYFEIVDACLEGRLDEIEIRQDNNTRVCVVGASRGYPDDCSKVKGKEIYGLDEAMEKAGVTVFGAGIELKDKRFYANGGRLFSVVAEGDNILEAKERAYSAISNIFVEGNNLHYRDDIGWRDVERFFGKKD